MRIQQRSYKCKANYITIQLRAKNTKHVHQFPLAYKQPCILFECVIANFCSLVQCIQHDRLCKNEIFRYEIYPLIAQIHYTKNTVFHCIQLIGVACGISNFIDYSVSQTIHRQDVFIIKFYSRYNMASSKLEILQATLIFVPHSMSFAGLQN